jgi:hypothetical protein
MAETKGLSVPNAKRIAVTVMYATLVEGKAPNCSVQITHLKPGTVDPACHACSSYRCRVGVLRVIRALDRLQTSATSLPMRPAPSFIGTQLNRLRNPGTRSAFITMPRTHCYLT